MPRCVKCNMYLPPNYTDILPNHMPDENGNYPQQCIFCKDNIEFVERETNHGSEQFVRYTKKQCIEDYKNFLEKLKRSRNLQEVSDMTKKM